MSRRPKQDTGTRWKQLVESPDDQISLLDGALLIAADEYPDLNPGPYVERIEALAAETRARLPQGATDMEVLEELNDSLFGSHGFAGNMADYYDPRNSYLNEVLDRKLGIPISLAVIYMEVADRLGITLEGVSFPGHFLVRMPVDEGIIVLDPFMRGASLGPDDLRERLQPMVAEGDEVHDDLLGDALSPAQRIEILARMLRNLKAIYAEREEWDKALRVTDRLLMLNPHNDAELLDRGRLYDRIGHSEAALSDYREFHKRAPDQVPEGILDRMLELSRCVPSLH